MKIKDSYGEGGVGVGSTKTADHPRISDVLRGMIDDIAGKGVTITSADAAVAAGDPPTKVEFDAVVTLVNEIKTKLNAASAAAASVQKG